VRYLLARPLPDELLGSVWIRTVRRAGLPVRAVASAVTGRKWAPGFFQVAHLTDLAPLLDMEPMALLWQHTVFPYTTAYFEQPVFETALSAALSIGIGAIGMGAVTQSASDLVPFRRFCTACAREDRHRWGESYWHRAHNLPGVLLCLRHGAVLRETSLRTTGWKDWDGQLPHQLSGKRLLHRRVTAFDTEVASRTVALLGREQGTPVARDPVRYRTQLIDGGLLTPTRQVNAQKLAQWVRGRMGGPPKDYGFTGRDAEMRWLTLMVRPQSGHPFVPLKHLLFEAALATRPIAGQQATVDHIPSGPSGRNTTDLDRKYAAAVRRVVAGYVKRGERVRIQDALTEAGCWSTFRHAREQLPRVATAVLQLKTSEAAARPRWGLGTPAAKVE